MAHDALGAHARDELGMHEATAARPLQAALSSAASFAVGAALPVVAVVATPRGALERWDGAAWVAVDTGTWLPASLLSAGADGGAAGSSRRRASTSATSGAMPMWPVSNVR